MKEIKGLKPAQCPKCEAHGERTNWLPDEGMDPTLREYKCPRCNEVWYLPTGRRFKVRVSQAMKRLPP
jgi:phage FluMu protein Com